MSLLSRATTDQSLACGGLRYSLSSLGKVEGEEVDGKYLATRFYSLIIFALILEPSKYLFQS